MRKSRLIPLVLVAMAICTLAMAQRTPQPSPPQASAADLEKLAAAPSMDDTILRLAAEKLRQERRPTATIELPVTIKVSTTSPPGCYHLCVWQGTKAIKCHIRCLEPPPSPD